MSPMRAFAAIAALSVSPASSAVPAGTTVVVHRGDDKATGRKLPPVTMTMNIPLAGSLQHIYGAVTGLDNPQDYRVRPRERWGLKRWDAGVGRSSEFGSTEVRELRDFSRCLALFFALINHLFVLAVLRLPRERCSHVQRPQ
jgi:hypothetical protein